MTTLERYIALGEIEIPRHPENNKRRLAVLSGGHHWYPIQKQIILHFTVKYLNEQGEPLNKISMPDYNIKLQADSETRIDPNTMSLIPHPGVRPQPVVSNLEVFNQGQLDEYDAALEVWNSSVTEYDHFLQMANAEVNIFQIEYNITLFRASQEGGLKFDV